MTIWSYFAALLIFSVLSYLNGHVEGTFAINNNISSPSTTTIASMDDNINIASTTSAKITTRNITNNNGGNSSTNNYMNNYSANNSSSSTTTSNYASNTTKNNSLTNINNNIPNNNITRSNTTTVTTDNNNNTQSSNSNNNVTRSNNVISNNNTKSSNSSRNTITNNSINDNSNNFTVCRCMPDSECWPSFDSWNELNRSIGGVLVRPSPPASPCYEGPNQNATACQVAATNWRNPFWRADQVGAMQYANNEAHGNQTCSLLSSPYFTSSSTSLTSSNTSSPPHILPNNASSPSSSPSLQCSQGAVPSYAIEVLDPSHVQTAVTFAAQNNLRLSVKSTGHDALGRSTAAGSLNLWMHRMKNITFHDSFTPDGCDANASFSAVTAESGTQWDELYAAADAKNLVVVGAMSGSVSTGGGYLQGGGHSPLSPFLGLAADNVIEMKVVMADGRLQTANACQNQEMFWALRGGGGGTFGVVVSCTHITYPALINVVDVYFTATSKNATIFEELLTNFIYLQSSLSQDNFWAGYSYITSSPTLSLTLNYLVPNCNTSIAEASFESLTNFTKQHSDEILANVVVRKFSSFQSWRSDVLCSANPGICSDPSGLNTALASRLLPQSVLQDQPSQVAQAFMEILANGVGQIVGHLVGGQTVMSGQSLAERVRLSKLDQRSPDGANYAYAMSAQNSPGYATSAKNATSSVNPAWRKALWHVVLINLWGEEESPGEKAAKVTQMNGLLRELTPGSGCYLNEADVNEPNWQDAFFGENYTKLKMIKGRVDPEGLFTCTNCVGSEEWTVNDQRICRRPSS